MNYKTIFIVDPVRGERIQLCKFIKQEFFTIMSFIAVGDCFKQTQLAHCDLVIYVLRRGKSEVKNLFNIKKKYKNLNFIIVTTSDVPEVNLLELQENGFTNVQKASTNEKIRELALYLLAPEGLPPRTETPHPVPIGIELGPPQPLQQS